MGMQITCHFQSENCSSLMNYSEGCICTRSPSTFGFVLFRDLAAAVTLYATTLPGSGANAEAVFCVAPLGCHQCSVPSSAATWVLLAPSETVHPVLLLAQQWPVEDAMCPSLGETREDVFRGHYLLLSHRSPVFEARPMQQAEDCQGSDYVWIFFCVYFWWFVIVEWGFFWCGVWLWFLILFFPQGPRSILLLFRNYLFFGVLLSFVCLAMLVSQTAL